MNMEIVHDAVKSYLECVSHEIESNVNTAYPIRGRFTKSMWEGFVGNNNQSRSFLFQHKYLRGSRFYI